MEGNSPIIQPQTVQTILGITGLCGILLIVTKRVGEDERNIVVAATAICAFLFFDNLDNKLVDTWVSYMKPTIGVMAVAAMSVYAMVHLRKTIELPVLSKEFIITVGVIVALITGYILFT